MNGLLLLDKPAGLTSHDAVSRLRRETGIQRIGHAGTLDPFATGLLLLLFGRATRLSQFFTGMDKEYRVQLRLGQESDTFDVSGKLLAERPVDFGYERFVRVLEEFQGDIKQVPPMYSAVRIDGQRLYKLARQGKLVERPARAISIYCLKVLTPEQDWKKSTAGLDVEILVRCSSGTYIRSLAHDLGARLGCGALVAQLRRIATGSYLVNDALELNSAASAAAMNALMPMESLLQEMPSLTLSNAECGRVCRGQKLEARPEIRQGWVRLLDPEEKLVAIGTAGASGIHPGIVLA